MKTTPWRVTGVLLFVVLVYCLYYWFLYAGFENLPDKTGALLGVRSGTFGDAFGVLNALFSGMAFSAALITMLLQRKDLSEAHIQNSRQQTESQFYNLLNLQQEVVRGFDLHVTRGQAHITIEGRDCFRDWHIKLQRAYTASYVRDIQEIERAREAYSKVLRSHQGDLGLYFRSLYNVFVFIERAEHVDKNHLGRIVRSLLSDYELVFIYYNCLTQRGEKFGRFAKEHAIFDNLDVELILEKEHLLFTDKAAFGDNSEALAWIKQLKK